MTAFFVKKRITTLMLVLAIMLAGVVAYSSLELAYYPNMDLPAAIVQTTYVGAAPEEIEDLITKPIEESVSTLSGVDYVISWSSANSSMVGVVFVDGTDIDNAVNDMREKVDRVKPTLPDDADDPMLLKMEMNATTISVGVTSDKYDVDTLYNLLDENISDEFERIDGVSSVSLDGGREDIIKVLLDKDKMEKYGVSMSAVSAAMKAENANTPAGSVDEGNYNLQIRTQGEFESIEDMKNLIISTNGGNAVLLKDIADVQESKADESSVTYINGKPGVQYALSKSSDGNIVTVTDRIVSTISKINEKYPDLQFQIMTTTSDYIKLSIKNIIDTAWQSALIAVLVLLFFLRDWKTSLIIGVSIPTSMFATFALMYCAGMTMNMVSMGGVVIAIGMLVDNSVVVLENIFQHSQRGEGPKEASLNGTGEVTMAVMASTLTSVAVFAPMLFIRSMMGQMLSNIALTIVFALMASLIVSLTFVPMASCFVMTMNEANKNRGAFRPLKKLGDLIGKFLDGVDAFYGKILHSALKHKVISVLLAFVVFVLSLLVSNSVGTNLMDRGDEGVVTVTAELPTGSKIEECDKMLLKIIDTVGEIPEQKSMIASATSGNGIRSSSNTVTYNLVDKEDRNRSADEIKAYIEDKVKNIAGAEITVGTSAVAAGSMGNSGIDIYVYGSDMDRLRKIYDDLEVEFINAGATNMESSLEATIPEASIKVDRAKAAKYGISTTAIANTVYMASNGTKASEYKHNGTEIDIRLEYPEETVKYIKDIRSMTITTPTGAVIPLSEVADIEMSQSPSQIRRRNSRRYLEITGEFEGIDSGAQKVKADKILSSYNWPEGYDYEYGGVIEMMGKTFSQLFTAIIVAVILVYMIMASQFESFVYPFILMFSMPISITGAIFGLFVTGKNISSAVYMGFILLVGMVVNNGIVLIDYANQQREKNDITADEAMKIAGPARLRPILMTTLTTIFGMMPMAMALGSGMESMQPLGIAVIFGLTASTMLTLVFIPVLYCIISNIGTSIHNRLTGRKDRLYRKQTHLEQTEVTQKEEEL